MQYDYLNHEIISIRSICTIKMQTHINLLYKIFNKCMHIFFKFFILNKK